MSFGIDALQAPILKYMWYTIILSLIVKYFLSQPNPITPKISLVILLTVYHTILMIFLQRIWYLINL